MEVLEMVVLEAVAMEMVVTEPMVLAAVAVVNLGLRQPASVAKAS